MLLQSKPKIFFDESTIIADRWSLELIADAARRLLPIGPGQHIFIKLDRFMDSHLFLPLDRLEKAGHTQTPFRAVHLTFA